MKIRLLAPLVGVILLAGCTFTGPLGAIAGGDATDAVVARAGQFNDRALGNLEKAEAFLRGKLARLARAKCLFPFAALVRYARAGAANRAAVEKDCGLAVNAVAATAAPRQ